MTDGRNRRAARTRESILSACRAWLVIGNFQPSAADVARVAFVSVRSVFQHFGDIESLRFAAIEDEDLRPDVLDQILGNLSPYPPGMRAETDRLLRIALTGRLTAERVDLVPHRCTGEMANGIG